MTRVIIEGMREVILPFVKKKLLEINYENLGKSDAEEFEKHFKEILDLAIKALEQEPYEDCVSREEVIKINQKYHGYMPNEVNHKMWKEFNELSSVQPIRIHARWEHLERTGFGDRYRCSSCNRILFVFSEQDIKTDFPYCHCGAKMVEPQESEGT